MLGCRNQQAIKKRYSGFFEDINNLISFATKKINIFRRHFETYRLLGVTSSASKNSSLDSVSLDAEASADMIFL